MSPRNIGLTGLFIAFVIALPLFVWSAININFNINENAQGEPNYCGGTCGSNYNCQANFFCFEGYCRNPICSNDIDCICDTATASPSTIATAKSTTKSTVKPSPTATTIPKGGNETFVDLATSISKATSTAAAASIVPYVQPEPSNQFLAKYALYIVGGFVLIVLISLFLALRGKKDDNIPHIMPPTNI